MVWPHSFTDLRDAARRRLPRFLFDYVDGGSFDQVALARNAAAVRAVALRQRVLNDVSEADLSTDLFGHRLDMPLMLAPVGMGGMLRRRGEIQAARAAQANGVPFVMSTVALCSIDEVMNATPAPFWFQLYVAKDRGFVMDLLTRAKGAGCPVLFMTVDLPVPGPRWRDQRSGLSGPPGLTGQWRRWTQILSHPHWALDVGLRGKPHTLGNLVPIMKGNVRLNDFLSWSGRNFDPSVTWKDLEFIRSHWDGPLVLKGIMDPEDARRAADIGADGLVVSNHGGRQLDATTGTAEALPAIAAAVGERLTVLADGGVRNGLDILRMLALGAKGVMIGRPWAFALAAGGEEAVSRMLAQMATELRAGLALTGCGRARDAGPHLLAGPPAWPR
ncbi:L-lactate dehydrogenase [Sphingobium lignivorans]|uniref:L-lactate dehydrogenase (Cytochrome) n=1 Tax=Sphingobium lignivorans TaxID=2735886 RepID=A0ABR6NA57_9SPHN|nr:L-lactate dehydrogenase [Sphingobium lignivorans]MBB5984162.1 L-lactate dehydrogenase (cytochrome) [Sphingobium lignivorans]